MLTEEARGPAPASAALPLDIQGRDLERVDWGASSGEFGTRRRFTRVRNSDQVPALHHRHLSDFFSAQKTRTSTTLADLVHAAILCQDFFGSVGIAEAVA
jgi:hypothetical protein